MPTPKKPSAAPKATAAKSRKTKASDAPAPVATSLAPAVAESTDPQSVTLTIKAQPGLAVFVAGSFNNWDASAIPMNEKKGVYSATLTLAPGIYEYKFVINGVWTLDPDPERDWTQNGLGTLNSLLRIG